MSTASGSGRSLALLAVAMTILQACSGRTMPLVTVSRESRSAGMLLRLLPAPGARINARLKPALERPDGTVLRFDSPQMTPDSSYFTAPPELSVTGSSVGIVRASVCPQGEEVCRMVEVRSEK